MSYDQGLAQRIRETLEERPGVTEKEMFGGLAFLLHGSMFVGIMQEKLMVRVGPTQYAAALAKPHAAPMDFAGRPMKGFIYVAPRGIESDAVLNEWVNFALDFVSTLPPKEAKPKSAPKRARVAKGSAAKPKPAARSARKA